MEATTINQTRVVAVRLEAETADRLERAAAKDQRSVGNALRMLISRTIGDYEREVIGASPVGMDKPAEQSEVAP